MEQINLFFSPHILTRAFGYILVNRAELRADINVSRVFEAKRQPNERDPNSENGVLDERISFMEHLSFNAYQMLPN